MYTYIVYIDKVVVCEPMMLSIHYFIYVYYIRIHSCSDTHYVKCHLEHSCSIWQRDSLNNYMIFCHANTVKTTLISTLEHYKESDLISEECIVHKTH